jgi:hypothetical protein
MPGTRSPPWRYPSRAGFRNRRYAADAELARGDVVLDRGSFAEGQQPADITHSLSHRTKALSSARLLISNAADIPLTAQRCSLATFDSTL